MKKLYFKLLMSAFGVLAGISQLSAQCTFTGLNANYCTNSAVSTLTPGTAGGTFSGPGVTGSVFSPSLAGPGTFTINYSLCSTTYSISAPTFSPLSTVGNTVAATSFSDNSGNQTADDGTSPALPIGFNF